MPLLGGNALLDEQAARADQLFRALALEALRRLMKRTPVDTGRARNNWMIGVDAPVMTNIPEGNYAKSGQMAIQGGMETAAKLKVGQVAWITNALPYIPALNEGHSSQMPAGWIELVMAELDVIMQQIQGILASGE